jgi:pimeloyl-ACP methyl ester carboxylesterase
MKNPILITFLVLLPILLPAQECDTFHLKRIASKSDTIFFKRIICFDKQEGLHHVRDYYPSGQIQMDAYYSIFDKNIKEELQCNYRTNTKQGDYREWWENGKVKFTGSYKDGRRTGICREYNEKGQIQSEEERLNGQLHGRSRYWTNGGILEHDLRFEYGINLNPRKVTYPYLANLPRDYDKDTLKQWPLIIFLHGGSQRGNNLKRLYDAGIPDQIYRGRPFPFIIISPLCPLHLRWSTENWFESFWEDIIQKYRIDTTRVYTTGMSLGGNGTWYLATKYPERFAAIAPISGFTAESSYIDRNIGNLYTIPTWVFHGKDDLVVAVEESQRMVNQLTGKSNSLKVSIEENIGHWIHWNVYPGEELYEWFLLFKKE